MGAEELNLTSEPVALEGVDPAEAPTMMLPDQLWHGGCPVDFDWVRREQIDAVVDVADPDTYPPAGALEGRIYIKCALVDDSEAGPDEVLTGSLARLAANLVRDGRRVLVHCTFGRNRSGLLVALIVRDVLRVPGADALEHVRALRTDALNNETFADWLTRLPAPTAPESTTWRAPPGGARRASWTASPTGSSAGPTASTSGAGTA